MGESTWLAALCSAGTLSLRMSTPLLLPSRPSAPSSSSTGALPVSSAELTTSLLPLSLVVTSLASCALCAWFPTPPPSLKFSPASTTSSILCTPSVHSFTGTSVKVWKKVNSPKLVRISLLSKRTTKKSVLKPLKAKARMKAAWTTSTRLLLSVLLCPCLPCPHPHTLSTNCTQITTCLASGRSTLLYRDTNTIPLFLFNLTNPLVEKKKS